LLGLWGEAVLTGADFDLILDVLIAHEGCVPWMYCDSRGFVTIGIGDKLTSDMAAVMPFVDGSGSPVDGEAKRIAFARVQDAWQPGWRAGAYEALTDLRLPVDYCRRRVVLRLKDEFIPAIERRCHEAASFPTAAKLALVDIAYNVGVAGFGAFHKLIDACNARNWEEAAKHVHTRKAGEDPDDWHTWGRRNSWRRRMMLAAQAVSA
jgi:GH24 family phage-related lysozyme (muramidase)